MTHQEYHTVMMVLQQYLVTAQRNQEPHGSYTPSEDQIKYNQKLENQIAAAIGIFENLD